MSSISDCPYQIPNVAASSPPPPYVAEEGVSNIDSIPSVPTVSQESSTSAGLSNDMRNTSTSGRVQSAYEASSSKPSKAKKPRLVMDCVLLPSNRSSVQVGSVFARRIVPNRLSFIEGPDHHEERNYRIEL